ncbi:hypothetical protein [Paraburkholderia sp.]|uniref:hypothetical protein n=1 Tax=Paraburkholderia sp. TaxID=1926495 RepID=UPI003C7C9FCA
MVDLLLAFEHNVAPITNPIDALDAFVEFHIGFHTERKNEVLLASTELRSLTGNNHKKIVTRRNHYEMGVVTILRRGCEEQVFAINNVKMTAYALIAMLTGVCTWYVPGGKVSRTELLGNYVDMARRLVKA